VQLHATSVATEVLPTDTFEPEVKLEVGLEGEDTGDKENFPGRRFDRRGYGIHL
jgi:hypothetical protein